ncbi:MAG TPA: glycosyl hydrolase family 18 protein [Candidatus Paceibacterota bacterium]|nr:glycosyl hydrolase family 18 protein [Candidatus Paceibacterota bacterium]
MRIRYLSIIACVALFLAPLSTSAATTFEVSGWLPYWTAATSTADVMPHLNEVTEINPFIYGVSSTGTIVVHSDITQNGWPELFAQARADHVRIVPTVMWSNGVQEQAILSDTKKRQALETAVANLAKQNKFDGIDIDFEGKEAQTKNYFSLFLKGLYERMGEKLVTCDIEARTPLSAQYYGLQMPDGAGEYANDYTQINKYCDRVHLMTYDQQSVDQQLAAAAASSSQLYAPVADPAWVEAVVDLAKQSINPKKLIVGIPTYGYEYQVTAYAKNQYNYEILWTFDPRYAAQIEQQYNVTPVRNPAGEEMLTYVPSASSTNIIGSNQNTGLAAAAAASLYANSYNSHLTFNMLDWSDAQSVNDKVQLAKALGVRGVALFEFDGGEDPNVWTTLMGVKK